MLKALGGVVGLWVGAEAPVSVVGHWVGAEAPVSIVGHWGIAEPPGGVLGPGSVGTALSALRCLGVC